MELKREDFLLITALDGQKVLGLRPDYFDEKPIEVVIKEVMEEKETVEIIIDRKAESLEKARAAKAAKKEAELVEIEKENLIEEKKAELAELMGD